ncbi:MAG: hypothetical protein K0R00_4267 [Herbinix sp.]|nr:hypothetical protein [Herbinix sp.]
MQKYFLYIIKSFLRRFHMHAGFIVMLSCAYVLPFIFTIVLDSASYGTYMQNFHITQGRDFRIENAKESDIAFFNDIDGIQLEYNNGTIYINVNEKNKRDELASLLFIRTKEVGDRQLDFINTTFDTSTHEKFAAQWAVINIILIAISMLIVQVTYSTHVGNFKADIGILEAIGASKKQIRRVFLVELILCFALATIIAFGIAYIATFTLFKYFLQIDTVETMSWIIFYVKPMNIIILTVVLLLFLISVFLLKFHKTIQSTTASLLSSTINDDRLKHFKNTFKCMEKPVKVISRIFLQRSNKVFVHSLIIAVPIIIVTVFILNYSIIYMDVLNQKSKYDLIIKKFPETLSNGYVDFSSGFSTEQKDYIKSLPEVLNAEFKIDMMLGDYLIDVSDKAIGGVSYPFTTIDGRKYLMVNICAFSDIPQEYINSINGKMVSRDGEMSIAVSKNYAFAQYNIGDEINLCIRNNKEGDSDIHEDDAENLQNSFQETIKLKIATLLDTPFSDEAIAIYFNDDDYKKITNGTNTNIIQITLEDKVDDVTLANKLSTYFNNAEIYNITNESEKNRIKSKTAVGIFILMEFVLGMVSIFMLITLFMLLSEYIRRQSNSVKLLFILGSSKRTIIKIYMRQTVIITTGCLAVSFGIGMLLSAAFFYGSGYQLIVSAMVLLSYAVVICLALLAFLFPVFLGLKKQLRIL